MLTIAGLNSRARADVPGRSCSRRSSPRRAARTGRALGQPVCPPWRDHCLRVRRGWPRRSGGPAVRRRHARSPGKSQRRNRHRFVRCPTGPHSCTSSGADRTRSPTRMSIRTLAVPIASRHVGSRTRACIAGTLPRRIGRHCSRGYRRTAAATTHVDPRCLLRDAFEPDDLWVLHRRILRGRRRDHTGLSIAMTR